MREYVSENDCSKSFKMFNNFNETILVEKESQELFKYYRKLIDCLL